MSITPVADEASLRPTEAPRSWLADPMPIAFALFGFVLVIYGLRFMSIDPGTLVKAPLTQGLNYGVLAAGIAETLAGILGIVKGLSYPAYVTGTFGIWLIGFFLLVTQGAEANEVAAEAEKAPLAAHFYTAESLAWYVLVLIIPVAILAVPAIVHRNVAFIVAFAALILLLLFLGLGYHDAYNTLTDAVKGESSPDLHTAINLLKASAWCGYVAAAAIFVVFAKEVYQITGVMRSNVPAE